METLRDILLTLRREPLAPMKLCYATNMSYSKFKECIEELESKGLVAKIPYNSGKTKYSYRLTDAGFKKIRAIEAAEI